MCAWKTNICEPCLVFLPGVLASFSFFLKKAKQHFEQNINKNSDGIYR